MIDSHERDEAAVLPEDFEQRLRGNEAAWQLFEARPPGYGRRPHGPPLTRPS